MKRWNLFFLMVWLSPLGLLAQQETVKQVLQHLDASGGLRVEYVYTMGDHTEQGVYYGWGQQFYLEGVSLKAWYNGTDLWLYVAQNGEVNLTRPEKSELVELNPLLALEDIDERQYLLSEQSSPNGKTIVARPKNNHGNTLESFTLQIDTHFQPLWVEVQEVGMEYPFRVEIKTLKRGEFPHMREKDFFSFRLNKLPSVEVIDLR